MRDERILDGDGCPAGRGRAGAGGSSPSGARRRFAAPLSDAYLGTLSAETCAADRARIGR
ncbi:hypothetical protein WMF11_20205 [Sorangium sp. So ce295]|uniref:hypothetical protein n=1 Tax=Sorangium sp. So ce295 TaxID=3133295 RepID=UPI003F6393BC